MNLTIEQIEEYQKRKKKLKIGHELKALAAEIRDTHRLTDREALEIFNGNFDLMQFAKQEVKRLKEENDRLQHWQITGANAINEKEMYRHKLQDALSTIEQIKERAEMALDETDKYGWTIGLTACRKYANEAIDRLQGQEQSGGTGE